MTLADGKKLDNILSVSTAASNKYLFHFNSFNSLTQWTAGIRLAVYEHTSLQEAYTGALIAGKGKQLNNIRTLLDRQRAKYEDWVRVRFGAGTPWRRCWCVVSPPDEKELAKLQKIQKKKDVYNRSTTVLKGDIKLYDSKKVGKRTRPIATITDAYSCYAIYPQSKQLIDQSTLVKVEGRITVHSKPEQTTEGFVFIMPESRPAITGFEIMLQFLFPVYDTFALYGRPNKLVADVLDTRGLMFAMPPDRRYGYLEMWDVVSLIHTEGSSGWTERQWRKHLKDLTSQRMATLPRTRSRTSTVGTRRNTLQGRTNVPLSRSGTLRFEEPSSVHSQPSTRQPSPTLVEGVEPQAPRRVDSAPSAAASATPRHQRSVSEQINGCKQPPSRLTRLESVEDLSNGQVNGKSRPIDEPESSEPPSPDSVEELHNLPEVQIAPTAPPQGPVASPPTFAHAPGQKPPVPVQHPGMKPNANIDHATLHQLADATNTAIPGIAVAGAAAAWKGQDGSSGARNGNAERENYQNDNANHLHAQGAYNSYSGYPGNRLATIPASPYVEEDQFVGPPATYQPSGPPVPEHAELPQRQNYNEYAQVVYEESEGSQIQRKPVPGRSLPLRGDDTRSTHSTTSSTLDSLRNDIIDPEALDRLEYTDPALLRQASLASSRYSRDDAMSTSTPDYASTTSEEAQPQQPARRNADRPRSGMLKFVGNPDLNPKPEVVVGDAYYKPAAKPLEVTSDMPAIDFGPTYLLDPSAKRPGTSGTMTQGIHDGSFSQSKENVALSLNEQKRQSYSGRTTPTMSMHMRAVSGSPQISDNRSVAWQPGMVAQPHPNNQKVEAEEWVAQRAAIPGQAMTPPAYAHARTKSHSPPISRTHSGDWSQPFGVENSPARPPSRPLSRPLSRGAGQLLEQRPTSLLVDKRPTNLSAREQEQVARITNTPLIDISKKPKKEQRPSSAGLTAYIDYREKEKAAAKANHSTSAMQKEIDRRMMAAQQRQMMEMQQQMGQQAQIGQAMAMTPGGYATPNMMAAPQGYPQAYAYSTPGQLQQTYQQQGYFPQQGMMTPVPGPMPSGWGAPSPQSMPAQYFMQQPQQPQQQQPATQPYGASFDQAQAAARYAHQQGQQRRQY